MKKAIKHSIIVKYFSLFIYKNNNKKESSDSYSSYDNVPMKKVKKNEEFNEDLSESSQLNQRNQKMLMINQDILAPPSNFKEE